MTNRLIIFTKAPVIGRAKTRLAAGVGKIHAHRIYKRMVSQVIRQTLDPRWETILAVTPDKHVSGGYDNIWPTDLPRMGQGQGSLSPRLTRALSFNGATMVIGTDAPQITSADIARGFKALHKNELVLGPADDGGFWLIGARGPVPASLFDGVAWSTETALKDVEANCDGKVAYLRTLIDVDDIDALRQVRG